MSIEFKIQYLFLFIAIVALIIGHKGMKRYIPVALFASLYANVWCYIATYFNWWEFPIRVVPLYVKNQMGSLMVNSLIRL